MTNHYRFRHRPDHPLAPKSGFLGVHRIVLYDKIGPGPHSCHWCGTEVNWSQGRIGTGALVVDHLDGNPTNNEPDNLVPSCHSCNIRRGHDKSFEGKTVLITDRGRQAATERVCVLCSKPFLIRTTALTYKDSSYTGEYCSRLCQNTAQARANAEKQKAATAHIAARVKELRTEGLTFAAIALRLDEEGIKPSKGERWHPSSVYVLSKR